MKVMIVQEAGRHQENASFRECFSWQRAFRELGHDTVVWGLGHDLNISDEEWKTYDLIVCVENYGDDWIQKVSSASNAFKVLVVVDAHVRGIEPYELIFKRDGYDLLCHATEAFVKKPHHRWLPNAADPFLISPKPNVPKKHLVGYCGSAGPIHRKIAIDKMIEKVNMHADLMVLGSSMIEAIQSYRIHWNMAHGWLTVSDINYRTFETLAAGTVLLTNTDSRLADLGFVNNTNCFMYCTLGEAIHIVETWQNLMSVSPSTTEVALQTIAENGRQLFLNRHTYKHRAEEMIRLMSESIL